MPFATVDLESSNPSFSSSPWILGAHHKGFAKLILRIRSMTSLDTEGRPANGGSYNSSTSGIPADAKRSLSAVSRSREQSATRSAVVKARLTSNPAPRQSSRMVKRLDRVEIA
jgi:hypothetical protein